MRTTFSGLALSLAALAPLAQANTYKLSQNFVGTSFLSAFSWEAESDPTHGRVNYVTQQAALQSNLTYASGNTFIMRADHTNVLSSSGPGRNSVRIKSNSAWGHGVYVWDIRHMPQGCGTWPAAWTTVESGWPAGGEIDIVEGVNDYGANSMTLHTSPGCTMPNQVANTMLGAVQTLDCNTADNGNAGCGIQATTSNSYGPSFNANGGGIYAMERTSSFIKIWFFPRRGSPAPPAALTSAVTSFDTSTWGMPQAYFPNTLCNIDSHFSSHNLIFDLTFCGDWAGASSIYSGDGCPSNCVDYVNQNPSAFANAYWDIAAVRVYQ